MAQLPIVAIVGRPNVGKSTLFNRYAGHRRALVADIPGLTRDRLTEEVEVAGRRVLLVDTAGLDPEAEAGVEAAVQAQARAAIEEADAILLVVDGQAGLLPEDAELARMLRRTRKPLAVAVNKVDLPAHGVRVAEFHAPRPRAACAASPRSTAAAPSICWRSCWPCCRPGPSRRRGAQSCAWPSSAGRTRARARS